MTLLRNGISPHRLGSAALGSFLAQRVFRSSSPRQERPMVLEKLERNSIAPYLLTAFSTELIPENLDREHRSTNPQRIVEDREIGGSCGILLFFHSLYLQH